MSFWTAGIGTTAATAEPPSSGGGRGGRGGDVQPSPVPLALLAADPAARATLGWSSENIPVATTDSGRRAWPSSRVVVSRGEYRCHAPPVLGAALAPAACDWLCGECNYGPSVPAGCTLALSVCITGGGAGGLGHCGLSRAAWWLLRCAALSPRFSASLAVSQLTPLKSKGRARRGRDNDNDGNHDDDKNEVADEASGPLPVLGAITADAVDWIGSSLEATTATDGSEGGRIAAVACGRCVAPSRSF